jgi:methionyl-tRNA formyltransferase
VETPVSLRAPTAADTLAAYRCELMVVVAYGLILPRAILDVPRLGCLNVHASLLPRWRGAAPIERAIIAGDVRTGVSLMLMDEGLDTGPVIARAACPILEADTGDTLSERLAQLGAGELLRCLEDPPSWRPEPQSDARATYAPKLAKSEAAIDWALDSAAIARLIRALSSRLSAYSWLGKERIRLLFATPVAGAGAPGEILGFDRKALTVACGTGAIAVSRAQLARGKGTPLDAAALWSGYRDTLRVGARFTRHAPGGTVDG